MSVIFQFPDDYLFRLNGFAFHRLRLRFMICFPDDKEGLEQLRYVHAIGGIDLTRDDPRTLIVRRSLRKIAERTLEEVEKGHSLLPEEPDRPGFPWREDTLRVYGELLARLKQICAEPQS